MKLIHHITERPKLWASLLLTWAIVLLVWVIVLIALMLSGTAKAGTPPMTCGTGCDGGGGSLPACSPSYLGWVLTDAGFKWKCVNSAPYGYHWVII